MYLGLDWSTQQLKSVITDEKGEILHEAFVTFDHDLPEFRTQKGVVRGVEKGVVSAPVLMWVKALDMLLERLRVSGADFSTVKALSGSAQQHGTVYWTSGAEETLSKLDDSQFLHSQLSSAFTVAGSPVWLDSSTTAYCRRLEAALSGGAEELAQITGSVAFERFSASQIAKIAETKPTAYKNTERISLVSSFGCSLFLGKYAPIDWSDGSGMNLFDIRHKTWNQKCLDACAPDLAEKLGSPVPSHTVLGKISNYFVERFGFSEDCSVVAFTGDNPSSLVGVDCGGADLTLSLGTSDVLMWWRREADPLSGGHLLLSPLSQHPFMAMAVFKNGSLTRERIKDSYASGSWDQFNKLLNSMPRGNFGYLGLYYDQVEVSLPLVGEYRYDKADVPLEKFATPEVEVRALVEGQMIAKRAFLENVNFVTTEETRIIATGGASANSAILQVVADVFNAPVYTLDDCNSSVLGAAYRAQDAMKGEGVQHRAERPLTLAATPFKDSVEIYNPMVARYRGIIKNLLESS